MASQPLTVDDLGLTHECLECNMTFDSKEKLHNHKTKFCVNSDYASPERLQRRIREEEAATATAYNFADVQTYLQKGVAAGDPLIGKQPLADVRSQVRARADDLDQMHRYLISQRQKEQVEELRRLKVEQARIRSERDREESALLEKLKELEEVKAKELRERMEREQARRELEGLDRTRLDRVEREKQEQLRRLEQERKALDIREQAILDEMSELEGRIASHNARNEANKRQIDAVLERAGHSNEEAEVMTPRDRLLAVREERARQRGAKAALARQRHQRLMAERAKLTGRLGEIDAHIAGGEQTAGTPELGAADDPVLDADALGGLVTQVKREQDSKAERIKQMHAMHAREIEKDRMAAEELDAFHSQMRTSDQYDDEDAAARDDLNAAHREADAALKQVLEDERKRAQGLERLLQEREEQAQYEMEKAVERERAEKRKLMRKHQSELEAVKSVAFADESATVQELRREIAELRSMYEDSGSEQLLTAIQDLEKEIDDLKTLERQASTAPPHHHTHGLSAQHSQATVASVAPAPSPYQPAGYPAAAAPGGAYPPPGYPAQPYPGYTHPVEPHSAANFFGLPPAFVTAQPSYMADPMMDMVYRQELENRQLEAELDAFLAQHNHPGSADAQSKLEKKLERILARIERMGRKQGGGGGTRGPDDPLTEMLADLPEGDDELQALKREHMKDMMHLEFEKAKTRNMIELNQLRVKQEETDLQGTAYAQYAADRRGHIDPSYRMGEDGMGDAPRPPYLADQGFAIYWDFVTGLPTNVDVVHVAYAFFDADISKTPIKSIPVSEVVADPLQADLGACVIGVKRRFQKVPFLPNLRVVVELQRVIELDEDADADYENDVTLESLGWTSFYVFEGTQEGVVPVLAAGYHRLPLFPSPVDIGASPDDLLTMARVPHVELFVRLFEPDFIDYHNALTVDPFMDNGHMRLMYPITDFSAQSAPLEPSASPPRQAGVAAAQAHGFASPTGGAGGGGGDHARAHSGPGDTGAAGSGGPQRGDSRGSRSSRSSRRGSRGSRRSPVIPFGVELVRVTSFPALPGDPPLHVHVSIERRDDLASGSLSRSESRLNSASSHRRTSSSQVWRSGTAQPGVQLGEMVWEGARWSFQPVRASDAKVLVLRVNKTVGGIESTVAWSFCKLFRFQASGELKVNDGTYAVAVHNPPITLPPEFGSELPNTQLHFRIFDPDSAGAQLQGEDVQGIARKSWMRVTNPLPDLSDDNLFTDNSGFDLYIDGARFLPDNVSITRVVGRVFNSAYEQQGGDINIVSSVALDSAVFSPRYNLRTVFRADHFDPTSTVLFKVVTVDRTNGNVASVGYAVLNVFLDAEASSLTDQPSNRSAAEYVLNTGAFQLPLMMGLPDVQQPLSVHALQGHKRVPCATLLVRILPAARNSRGELITRDDAPQEQWEALGLAAPAPPYSAAVYDSTRCEPEGTEHKLYTTRQARDDKGVTTVREVLVPLGYPGALNSDSEIHAWIAERLTPAPGADEVLLDYAYLARYAPEMGFRVAIDGANNLPKAATLKMSGLTVAMFSLSPPASLYHPTNPLTSAVELCTTRDWNATIRCPRWADGFRNFKNVPYNPFLVVVIEIMGMGLKKKKKGVVVPAGWTVLPVFTSADQYVQSGAYRLPLFRGRPTPNVLERIFREDAYTVLQEMLDERVIQLESPASVLVRLVDDQRDDEYKEPGGWGFDPFISAVAKPEKYVKEVITKPLRTRAGKKMGTQQEVGLLFNQVFCEAMGIHHLGFGS